MTRASKLVAWLESLPEDAAVAIDDAGYALCRVDDPGVYFDVGDLPGDEESEECPF